MIRHISKIGNSQGLMFDKELLAFTKTQSGDSFNLTPHEGVSILTPLNPRKGTAPQAPAGAAQKAK